MDADGSNPVNLTNTNAGDHDPHWSPDGSKIAFHSSGRAATGIYVMNSDGSNQTRLGSGTKPSWSPDGTKIVYDGIKVMNADGSGETSLQSGNYPSWSSSGNRIVFVDNRDGDYGIFTMDADGSDETRLTSNGNSNQQPDW
jgi:Tol biopolymer transport system component